MGTELLLRMSFKRNAQGVLQISVSLILVLLLFFFFGKDFSVPYLNT